MVKNGRIIYGISHSRCRYIQNVDGFMLQRDGASVLVDLAYLAIKQTRLLHRSGVRFPRTSLSARRTMVVLRQSRGGKPEGQQNCK